MTQAIGDRAMVDACGDQVGRVRVPQIMQSDVRQPEACERRQVIPIPNVGWVERRPCGRAEDEAAVAKFRTQTQALLLLPPGGVPDRRYGFLGHQHRFGGTRIVYTDGIWEARSMSKVIEAKYTQGVLTPWNLYAFAKTIIDVTIPAPEKDGSGKAFLVRRRVEGACRIVIEPPPA